jgi:hypothetical protein
MKREKAMYRYCGCGNLIIGDSSKKECDLCGRMVGLKPSRLPKSQLLEIREQTLKILKNNGHTEEKWTVSQ